MLYESGQELQLSPLKSRKSNIALKRLVRFLPLLLLLIPVASTEKSPAGFSAQVVRAHVEIDGVEYGAFDQVEGLVGNPELQSSDTMGAVRHRKVSLQRDFVTNPSLYLWAKSVMEERSGLKDVQLVLENRDGEVLSRYVLKLCQPLSWSLEAANPALGGFHEKVDLAVQDISLQ